MRQFPLGVLVWVACVMSIAHISAHAAPAQRPALSAQEVVETMRVMDDPVSVSPDGSKYVMRVVCGDVEANGSWIEVLVGGLRSLADADSPETVARLFTTGLGAQDTIVGPDSVTQLNPLRWVGNDRVAFFASDQEGVRQLVEVDLRTRSTRFLTASSAHVYSFDVGQDGTVIYQAQALGDPLASARALQHGLTIGPEIDGMAVVQHRFDGRNGPDVAWNSEWFVKRPDEPAVRLSINQSNLDITVPLFRKVALSPSGRFVVIDASPLTVPDVWKKYRNPAMQTLFEAARQDRRSFMGRRAIQYFLLDLKNGISRPLWNAPINLNLARREDQVAWSPDERFVVLANTFLPPDTTEAAGLGGSAVAVVDVRNGSYAQLPVDLSSIELVSSQWLADGKIELRTRSGSGDAIRVLEFVQEGGRWKALREQPSLSKRTGIRIDVRQSLNTPPEVYAVDIGTGEEQRILQTNQQIIGKLGRVEKVDGKMEGSGWSGLLFYPTDFKAGHRYPLVIQATTPAPDPNEFTLSGWQRGTGIGPTTIAVYPGQVLAGRGIAVLMLKANRSPAAGDASPRQNHESTSWRVAAEAAIRELSEKGLVDPARVGVVGFSRPGYVVSHMLTHSAFPFVAAVTADNYDASYIQTAFTEWDRANGNIGARPFGDGLKIWLENATGFNVEKIRPPLLMIEQSLDSVVGNWEVFSRLRHLGKPVEMYLMPDISDHPSHTPQNPAQILAIQNKVVDWFDFWLNGNEDADPAKADQYKLWRAMQIQHAKSGPASVP